MGSASAAHRAQASPGSGRRAIWLFGAVTLWGCSGAIVSPGGEAAPRILFVGNSLTHTNDLPGMLRALGAADGGRTIVTQSVTPPGFGLIDHWASGQAVAAIRSASWTWVVLQQGPSATEGRPSLIEFTERFAPIIREAGAVPALYMVWPDASRPFDRPGVSSSYTDAARAVDGVLLPAGDAWRSALELDPDLPLYGPDGFHPSEVGTYLAALVIYQQLTERSPIGLPGTLQLEGGRVVRIPTQWTRLLQEAAAATNARL